jgi:recombination protein RecR
MGNFSGYYHVLGGLISPFDDIGPDDIDLKGLLERVKKDKVKEIIFVTKSGIEADTTILYIKKCLEGVDVVISRVANGIPIGADMDYIDSLTLESALKNRKEVLD